MKQRLNGRVYPLLAGVVLLAIVLLFSCRTDPPAPVIRIGFSQCVGTDKWRKTMLKDIQRELSFHPRLGLICKDANNNSALQVQQIRELAKEGIDLLIVSPNEAVPLTPVIEELYNKGLPVIVVDRKIASSQYTAYIGGDNYEIGKRIGEYAVNFFHGHAHIVEVMGLAGSSPAIERDKGFSGALRPYPGMTIIARVYGNWLKDSVAAALGRLPPSLLANADLVFSHNDRMALGVSEFFQKQGFPHPPMLIGVDGLPGPGAGLDLVSDHTLTATALYPTGGEEAIRTALAILEHREYTREERLQTVIIDSTNVRLMALQVGKVNSQQNDIERQQRRLNEQAVIYRNQHAALVVILVILVLSVGLGSLTFYSLRENKKINRRLKQKNEEIVLQQQQLIEMSHRAEAAHDAKLKFFTNISHEFRTPLTLILAPLEDLLTSARLNFTVSQHLKLVHQNVIRLLRLVNQLMDFRKVEGNKLRLKVSEHDLVTFIEKIMEAFRPLAVKQGIDFRLIAGERSISAFFDQNMLDKVVFNLLSNAFKFTPENGFVHLTVDLPSDRHISIRIEDSGVGMTPETAEHAFDPFYSSEMTNTRTAGLGLALSRELITLHHGKITVQSAKGKGTLFEITLPAGAAHFSAAEIVPSPSVSSSLPLLSPYTEEKIFIADLEQDPFHVTAGTEEAVTPGTEQPTTGNRRSILIVEDNINMLNFLKEKLKPDYDILVADDGVTALQQAFDYLPDLIICDIVIPLKDGISLTSTIKKDIRTSHIPVILLTARTTIEDQIEGWRNMADAYLGKPFHLSFLKEIMTSLLRNRDLLREHYTSALPADNKGPAPRKSDRKFVNEFTATVESNLSNESFTIDTICTAIGISRMQLYRKVKVLLGCNVNDYILTIRIQKAKYFLKEGDLSIAEISFRVGFSSAAYFSTVFKSRMNMTPKEYRNKNNFLMTPNRPI